MALVDIAADTIGQVAEELKSKGVDALAIRTDATDRADIGRMIDTIVKKWGKLTIGVNNAGMGQWVDAEDITDEIWRKIMKLNLDAVLYCSQAEAAAMKRNSTGRSSTRHPCPAISSIRRRIRFRTTCPRRGSST